MSTTTHPFTPEEIMTFVDGELSADRAQSISAHIDQCPECHTVFDSVCNVSKSLSNWSVSTLPTNLEGHVLDRTQVTYRLEGLGFLSKLQRFLRRPPLFALGSVAVVLVLILIGMSAGRYDRSLSRARRAVDSARQLTTDQRVPAGRPESRIPADSNGLFHGLAGHAKDSFSADDEEATDSSHIKVTARSGLAISGPMIARTVSLSIVANEFDASRATLEAILARHNGYAAALNVATPQGAGRTIQASLRIPAPQLVAAVAELKALGRVENETQNGEEVTHQHADLVARLKNSRETEQRLQDVLRTRTGKVKDVLEVEEEIARVRGEIEEMEAEQQTLEHRVNFATIDLKLAEEYKAQLSSPAPSVGIQLRNATVNGFRNASESLLGILLFFAESGPTLLLWLLILLFPARLIWKRYRRSLAMASSSGV
jgi:hypothetical protein